jgi:hypothetical protein
MPERTTIRRAERARKQGKSPATQAGAFVKEEMDHVKQGKHGVSSKKQAIAIALSKARRSGVKLAPPKKGKTVQKTEIPAARAGSTGTKKSGSSAASSKSRKKSK